MRKTVKNLVLLAAAATLTLGLSGCSLERPEAPSWDTTLTIPIVNKKYSSAELLDKLANEHIETDSAGNSFLHIREELDTVSFDNTLTIDGMAAGYSHALGIIKVVVPAAQQQQLALADYVPLIAGSIPDVGLWVEKPLEQPGSFSEAEVADGDLVTEISNNTGFQLDSLTLVMVDNITATEIFTRSVAGGLDVGDQSVETIPLDGKQISNDLRLDIYFHTPGGAALTLADRTIDFDLSFSDEFYVSSVTGQINQFSSEQHQREPLATDNQITNATFDSGLLSFTATNTLALDAQLEISFPDISNDGSPLSLFSTVVAGSEETFQADLSGHDFTPTNDSISIEIVASIPGSGEEFVTLNSTDEFDFSYELTELKFSHATAVIAPTEVDVSDNTIEIEIPTGFENASLDQVDLTLTILNGSQLSGDIEITLEGSNGNTLVVAGEFSGGSHESPAENIITSSSLAELLDPIPDQIVISGIVTVGDGLTEVDISSLDFLCASAVISAPMVFTLGATTIEGEKEEQELDEKIRERIENLHEGTFHSEISNHLPFGAEVTLYISTDSVTLYEEPLVTIGPVRFDQGVVDASGNVSAVVQTESSVSITQNDLQVFSNEKIYVGEIIELPGSNGQTIRIRSTDFLQLVGYLEVVIRVDEEVF